ncbi:MAG TPA: FAD-binding protein [Methanomassiliicoccales archaeon]|nr:FAD-binding protein [Methanomassiliicoccales archaeon]
MNAASAESAQATSAQTTNETQLEAPSPAPAIPKVDPWRTRFGPEQLFHAKSDSGSGRVANDLAALKIPDLKVISAKGWLALYSRDQADVPDFLRTLLFKTVPSAVAQPFSTEAIAAVLKYAASRNIAVIVRGAGSSPFGGSMPVKGGIVLDMNALDKVLDVDAAKKTVKVQAGMRWADLDWYLEQYGLSLRSCPSSRFSTIGGWVATGGIGVGSVSGGHLSRWVDELEVVASDGTVRSLRPTDKDFMALFGSEGRVAVIASVTLNVKDRVKNPVPTLVLFEDRDVALHYAKFLAMSPKPPMDLTYYSPAKFVAINKLLGASHFTPKHGVMACYESEKSMPAAAAVPAGAKLADAYLAHLIWNERFFPMKFRKLGPGLMGSEVKAPREHLEEIASRAERVCKEHGLEPLMEVHFMPGGDGLLLTYYITDQTQMMRYTMDSFRGLLISSAVMEAGAKPYSAGVWNNMFSDREDKDSVARLEAAKNLDPAGIMNKGKYPRLSGKFGGVPASLFSPGVLGSALRMINRIGEPAAVGVGMISSAKAFNRRDADPLLRAADECAMCGACVGVCPAYLVIKDERVTARGKLLTARALADGSRLSPEHAHRTFLCMRCKACEQVCQSKLHLIEAYDELEKRLAASYGKDEEEIKRFVQLVENSAMYDALVDRGLVLGAPSKTVDGGK